MNTPKELEIGTDLLSDIELGEALERLEKNKDFKMIIKELFLDGGSINLSKNLVVVRPEKREAVIEQITSRGYLYRFLMEIKDNGINANEAMRDMQEAYLEQEGEN